MNSSYLGKCFALLSVLSASAVGLVRAEPQGDPEGRIQCALRALRASVVNAVAEHDQSRDLDRRI